MDTSKRKNPGITIPVGEVQGHGVIIRKADKERLGEDAARKRATALDKRHTERPAQ